MNKYQEALVDIRCDIHNFIDNNYDEAFKMVYNKQFKTLQEAVDKANKYDELQKVYFKNEPMESADLNTRKLQELYDFNNKLVDKETPKETIKENFEDDRYNCYKHSCPTCGYCWVCDVPNYCSECGQKLDRSDE